MQTAAETDKPAAPGKPEDRPDKLNIGPFAVTSTQLLLTLATCGLFVIELQKLAMLKMPFFASLAGFELVAAAINNLGLMVVLAGLFSALMLLGLLTLAAVALGIAVLCLGSMLLIARSHLGWKAAFIALSRVPMQSRHLWFRVIRNDKQRGIFARKLERFLPILRRRREAAERRYAGKIEKAWHRWRTQMSGLRRAFGAFYQTFITFDLRTPIAALARWIMLAALLLFMPLANRVIIHSQEVAMFGADKAKDIAYQRPWADWVSNSRWPRYLLSSGIGKAIVPPFETGQLTLSKPVASSGSHLLPDTSSETRNRTEKVYYIGDFGEWALVAPAREASLRLMIQRKSIVEFGRFEPAKSDPPVVEPVKPTVLQFDFSGNSFDFSRRITGSGPGPDDVMRHLAHLEGRADQVDLQLAEIAGRLARLPQPPALSGTYLKKLTSILEAQQKFNRSDARRHQALTRIGAKLTDATRAAGRSVEELYKLTDQRLTSLEQAARRRPPPGGNLNVPGEVLAAMQDGLTTRTTGILTDLQRQLSVAELADCRENSLNLLGHVEFAEGQVSITARDQRSALENIAAALRALHEDGEKGRVLFLGGASYTGMPEKNLRYSEMRAEHVMERVLRDLGPGAAPTQTAEMLSKVHGLEFIAFGLGERLPHANASPRAVEARFCQTPRPSPLIARND